MTKFKNASSRDSQMPMRILLQQIETGFYYQDSGAWTPNPVEAMDFVSSSKAIDYCVTNKIAGVQLVLKFEDHLYDIVLPMVVDQRHQNVGPRPSAPEIACDVA
jgi:hypothetical protein